MAAIVLDEADVCRLGGEFLKFACVARGDERVARTVHDEDGRLQRFDDVIGAKRMADKEARGEVSVGE